MDRTCPGEGDSLLSRAPPKDTNALSSQPEPPQQHPLPTNIPLPSVHPLHQPEQLIPLPREQPKQPHGRRRRDTCLFQAAQNTHPPPHTQPQGCPPSSSKTTAGCSHLPSLQEAPPGARSHPWVPRWSLGEHPGMLPTHPALTFAERHGAGGDSAGLRLLGSADSDEFS